MYLALQSQIHQKRKILDLSEHFPETSVKHPSIYSVYIVVYHMDSNVNTYTESIFQAWLS